MEKTIYTKLAKDSILETFGVIKNINPKYSDFPELKIEKACFVTLHLKTDDSLRGCIGTLIPTEKNLYHEIVKNAKSAAFNDHRFKQLGLDEINNINISVDLLSVAKKINSKEELDPEKYGIIITQGNKRGILLPNLKGITHIEQQINIAAQKANISGGDVTIYKFTVERHF